MADDTAMIINKYQEIHDKIESLKAEFIQFNKELPTNIDSATADEYRNQLADLFVQAGVEFTKIFRCEHR